MKKIIFAVLLVALITVGLPLFAQNSPERTESDYYYVNISLEKVWPYRRGYIVQYRRGLFGHGRAYLPAEWFSSSASGGGVPKGEILNLPTGRSWPSMSVFYRDGAFSHVRLYVHRMHTHQTWGRVPQAVNLDSNFDDIETVILQR
ncbi:MAG: hypothetical protein FWG89_06925 [Treponema sp.]|nr:hypothetical protein [Treponema sp.]